MAKTIDKSYIQMKMLSTPGRDQLSIARFVRKLIELYSKEGVKRLKIKKI